MALPHDGAAGGFVAAARLHADIAVLDQVEAADAVFATQVVEFREHLRRRQLFAVDGGDVTAYIGKLDHLGLVRGFFRGHRQPPH